MGVALTITLITVTLLFIGTVVNNAILCTITRLGMAKDHVTISHLAERANESQIVAAAHKI